MKWRCPQCGKPHERNDPPCDNCGHHKFERAVVPVPQAEENHEQFVWACSDCGRHHQRNNPPCSRCGGTNFEKKPLEYDEFESPETTPGYLELVGRQELAALAVVVALVAVGVLGFLGVVQIPGITPQPPPSVEDPPGDPDRLGSTNLSAVETAVLAGIDDQRSTALRESGDLDRVATYLARRFATEVVAGRQLSDPREAVARFETPCSGDPAIAFWGTNSSLAGVAADTIAASVDLQALVRGAPDPADRSVSRVGIDAHALPNGGLIVAAAYC